MVIINPDGSVDFCPETKKTWEARAQAKKADCGGESVFHCLSDIKGKKWEKCVPIALIGEGNCPVFTSDGYLDWKPCNISEPFCPNSSYVSDEVYKYPFCFGDNAPWNQTSKDNLKHDHDGPAQMIIILGVLVLLSLAALIIFLTYRWRRTIRERRLVDRKWVDQFQEALLLPDVDELVAISSRDTITKGVSQLSEENIKCIFVIGGIGNLMTSTARSILEMYAMKMGWNPVQCQFPNVPTEVKEETIMFIYGWFGLWDDDLCSLETAKSVCKKLVEMLEQTPKVKVIIGMRMDLYDRYLKDLKEYSILFANTVSLDNENISRDYTFYWQMIKDDCRVRSCPCRDLTIDMLRGGGDKLIGMPLKVEVISKHHDPVLIQSYIDGGKWDILTAMSKYFTALKKSEKPIYEWIMYICLKGHFSRSEIFDRNLVKNMDLEIKHSSFDEDYMQLRKYIRVWSIETQSMSSDDVKYVFWHPFIYICAFHSLYQNHKDIVMKHCNLDAIMQLLRPKNYPKTVYHLEVSADEIDVEQLRERLRKKGLEEKYKDHPLLELTPLEKSTNNE